MIRLIRAEQIKIYSRPMVWAMAIIFVIIVIMTALFNIDKRNASQTDDWKTVINEENQLLKEQMKEAPEDVLPYLNSQIQRNEYALENGVSPDRMTSWKFLSLVSNFLPFVTLFTLIVASDIVASEFKWDTMKLLLIRPVRRYKILLAKYCSVLMFSALLICMIFLSSWIIGTLLFGVDGASEPFIFSKDKQNYEHIPMVMHVFLSYGLKMITLCVIVTMAFVISILFRSNSLAIAFSVFILFGGNMISAFLSRIQPEFAKYFLFSHLNLEAYFTGTPIVEGVTLPFSLIILSGYMLCFYAAGWVVFTRREMG
ncbi:ABC transporter permease [Paenibacillus algorifonticola]|uniref:ABC transporter permease n=1 Tax=Paenibacillus algorifonticola TaxID=684063 RepID=UPI003D2E5F3D